MPSLTCLALLCFSTLPDCMVCNYLSANQGPHLASGTSRWNGPRGARQVYEYLGELGQPPGLLPQQPPARPGGHPAGTVPPRHALMPTPLATETLPTRSWETRRDMETDPPRAGLETLQGQHPTSSDRDPGRMRKEDYEAELTDNRNRGRIRPATARRAGAQFWGEQERAGGLGLRCLHPLRGRLHSGKKGS